MREVHIKRFKALIKTMDRVAKLPRSRFYMESWLNSREGPKKKNLECGFAGCAIGWYWGLNHKKIAKSLKCRDNPHLLYEYRSPGFFRLTEIAKHFGITPGEAERLFLPADNHRTATQVSKNIKAFFDYKTC